MTKASMQAIDSGISDAVTVGTLSSGGYCLKATVGNKTWAVHGPGATWYKAADCTGTAVSVNS